MAGETTVVLGWDGLDSNLLNDYGLTNEFGESVTRIDTYENPILETPHTDELWPSMITGQRPEGHGVHAATDSGVDWDSNLIRLAATASTGLVPESAREAIGRMLRSHGAGTSVTSADYYADMWTVFDGRKSFPVNIPNYWTNRDSRLGFPADRGQQLSDYLDRTEAGWNPTDADALQELEETMATNYGAKLGVVKSALQRDYDLIWVWFGLVDTAGHVDPLVGHDFQRRTYDLAATATKEIRSMAGKDTTVLSVSDHGLQDGKHTMDAVVGGPEGICDRISSVFDVANVVDTVTPSTTDDKPPTVSEYDDGENEHTPECVRGRLEELGYL